MDECDVKLPKGSTIWLLRRGMGDFGKKYRGKKILPRKYLGKKISYTEKKYLSWLIILEKNIYRDLFHWHIYNLNYYFIVLEMVTSETTKCHSFVIFITTTMLFGMVSCHFRVGREFNLLHPYPSQEQQLPVFRERLPSRIFPEWFRRPGFKNFRTVQTNEEEM